MPRYKFVVFTRPVEGREAEYNDWYQNTHLAEVLDIPGHTAAQRFRLNRTMGEGQGSPYMAIYDVETDDIDGVFAEMNKRFGTGQLKLSDALAPGFFLLCYEEFGAPVKPKR
jgi:hypothetical protein